MAILSVDLAHSSYVNVGGVILTQRSDAIDGEFLDIALPGDPSPRDLALFLDQICRDHAIRILLLHGPQSSKSVSNSLAPARTCEQAFRIRPSADLAFLEFSIALYDVLTLLGWERLEGAHSAQPRILVESFPPAAWRALGLKAGRLSDLQVLFPLDLPRQPSDAELQAIIAGLAGLALERLAWDDCAMRGEPPVLEYGLWREGYIVCPLQSTALL